MLLLTNEFLFAKQVLLVLVLLNGFIFVNLALKEETEQTLQRTREVGSLTLAASLAAELGVRLLMQGNR